MRSDDDLLTAARGGDADAFAVFYRRHASAVTCVASPPRSWAASARRARSSTCSRRNACRHSLAAPELAFDLTAETFAALVGALNRFDPEPIVLDDAALARVEARADGGALEALMASLPAAEREAVEARVLAEAEYAEIAERLRCSEAVVRQRVSRGLRRLRKAMAEDGAG